MYHDASFQQICFVYYIKSFFIITIAAGVQCIVPENVKGKSTVMHISLSASGSINFPKLVTKWYFLATFPSRKSVRLVVRNTAKA
jgi:hypothetical protein